MSKKIMCVNDVSYSLPAHVSSARSGNGAEKPEKRVTESGVVSGQFTENVSGIGAWRGR